MGGFGVQTGLELRSSGIPVNRPPVFDMEGSEQPSRTVPASCDEWWLFRLSLQRLEHVIWYGVRRCAERVPVAPTSETIFS